ncbi:MAG: hypothetical protein GX244_00310 [Firmicutes bacterium]|nr:hypothetical protein [Bacillota bacterium]
MPVEVKLKSKGAPGWNTHIAESKFFINKVEVVVQTFTVIVFQESVACFFIMPWLVAHTGFHSGEDMDYSWMVTSFLYDFLDAGFFTKCFDLADKFDFNTIFFSNSFRIFPDLSSFRGWAN